MALEAMPDGGPNMARQLWAVAVVWVLSVVSATLALIGGDWLPVVTALSAAVSAAGWLVAVRQWALWRQVAESAFRELERRGF